MTDSLPMTITAPLTNAQRTALLNLLRRAAKSEILPRFKSLTQDQIMVKTGPDDLVTEADKAAEAMIARGILTMFPNALIVGEENASDNPEIIARINDAELAFTVDPVDGTWNYAHGLTTFGVILSVTRFGRPVFAALYDPIMNDFVVADTDGPAEMLTPRRARRVLSTSKGGPVEALSGYVPFSTLPADKRAPMAATYPRFGRISNLRCACQEMRMLAQGHVDFVLATKLTPWDHAAGTLTTLRAGGHVAMLDGSEYLAGTREGYLLCASDAATWGRVRDVFDFLLDAPKEDAPA